MVVTGSCFLSGLGHGVSSGLFSPDGLERVAEDEGFSSLARESPFSLAADYLFPGIENETLAIMLAGWLGTVVLFGVAYGLARLIISRKKQAEL